MNDDLILYDATVKLHRKLQCDKPLNKLYFMWYNTKNDIFCFVFHGEKNWALAKVLAQYASDKTLDFGWYDAFIVFNRYRKFLKKKSQINK